MRQLQLIFPENTFDQPNIFDQPNAFKECVNIVELEIIFHYVWKMVNITKLSEILHSLFPNVEKLKI